MIPIVILFAFLLPAPEPIRVDALEVNYYASAYVDGQYNLTLMAFTGEKLTAIDHQSTLMDGFFPLANPEASPSWPVKTKRGWETTFNGRRYLAKEFRITRTEYDRGFQERWFSLMEASIRK